MLFNKKLDKKDKTKKGFTLVELLAVIVVITLISSVGIITYLKTINNSKSKATLLAINNIKEAAYLYSKEGTDEIEWVNSYGKDGKESGKYACVSVQQLINKGYFNDNFFDKEIYKNSKIDKNTFIEVSMGTNNDNLKVVVNKNYNTKDKCIGSAINGNLFHLRLGNDSKSYTDTIKLKVSSKDNDIIPKNYIVSIDDVSKKEESTTGEVTFKKLTNSTSYKIKACMITENGNYYCDYFSILTKDFIKPKFNIDSGWQKAKTININYDDTPIYGQKGSHYFTSEVSGEVKKGTVYRCNDDYSVCSSNSDGIVESDKNYKLNGKEVSFTTTDNIENKVSKKLTAIIEDPTNNSGENSGTVNKIDNIAPICNASSSNSSWTNQAVTISSTCEDGNGSGCKKTIFTKKINEEFVGNASIEVTDKAGNSSTCKTPVMIDKTKPTCTVSSSNSNWTNQDVTVTGTCSDSKSDCKAETISVTKKSNIDDDVSPGTVYDNAGNKTQCGTTRVRIDKTPPIAKIGHDADNYKLTNESTDSGGSGLASSSWWGAEVGTGGTRYLKVIDGAGNWSEPTSISVYKYCSQGNWKNNTESGAKIYKWGNTGENHCKENKPYLRIHFKVFLCNCKVDKYKTTKLCDSSVGKDITSSKHPNGYCRIYYNKPEACSSRKNGHVIQVGDSTGDLELNDKKTEGVFHGYKWYHGDRPGNGYKSFENLTGVWLHNGGDFDSVNEGDANNKSNACKKACEIQYRD